MSARGGKELRIGRSSSGKELCIALSALSDGGKELCIGRNGGGKDLRIGRSGDPPTRQAPLLESRDALQAERAEWQIVLWFFDDTGWPAEPVDAKPAAVARAAQPDSPPAS